MFVIGSKNSSNSLRLVEVAKRSGCENTFLIDSKNESETNDIQKYKNIGITSGASAPEKLVFDLINMIKKLRPPFNLPPGAVAAGIAALNDDIHLDKPLTEC